MNVFKKTVAYLAFIALAMTLNVAQGQVTFISNTQQQPTNSAHQVNAQHGFSMAENDQAIRPAQNREVMDWINIGNNSSPWGSYNYPVDFYMNTSLTQSIYTAAEMNHGPCLIEQVKYTYKTITNNYPNVIDTETFKVWMCNTGQSSLSEGAGYWIPAENFTLVYEGGLVLNGGQNQPMLFNLTQPFVYNGANICIMVEHIFSVNTFENHFNFEASTLAEGDVRARLYVSFSTPFDFDLPTTDPSQTGMTLGQLADVQLGISTAAQGSLTGTITNPAGNPIANALVTIQGTDLQTQSNAQGQYNFSFVVPGTYTVNYSSFGYVIASANVEVAGSTTQNIVLAYLPKATVQGTVLDNDNAPIVGANIHINGYAGYNGTSDASGNFTIPEVYYDANYVVTVSKNGYLTQMINLAVGSSTVAMGTIQLTDKLESPSNIKAVKTDDAAQISWLSPSERTVYRRDGGELITQIGHNYAGAVAVFGQVFREPARLYQMSWYLNNVEYPHDFVNVFVFALNAQGNPTNTIIFEQANIPNVDLQWSTFTFPDTLTIQNGFYIAISHPQRLEIGIDAGADPEYPFENNVNWVSEDYTTNDFLLMENLGLGPIPGNLMIRAEGYNLNTGKKLQSPIAAPSRSLNNYKISRLKEGQEQTPELWTLLNENNTTTSFTDVNFSSGDAGWYKFAVQAVYSGGVTSEVAFSNRIENKLTTQVTFNITTNTPTNESMGATIKLTSNNGNNVYSQTIEAENGVVVFPAIFKGTYAVLIQHDGFDDFTASNVDFSTEPNYTKNYQLVETLLQPFNLEIDVQDDLSAVFNWNRTANIIENFESCNNFELNPQGVVNWKYHDVDMKSTIGIDNFTYPNENEPNAFMIFTPSETTPPISINLNPAIAPHSGNKFLAGFGVNFGSNNDYFISPALNFGQNFTFAFWAKSFSDAPSPNKIMVGYSTTGFQPADFTWITTSAITLPFSNWTQYSYNLTSDIKYVTIRNVSDGGYILMIDDVEIFAAATSRSLVKYQVYLNNNLMGETNNTTFDFASADIIYNQTNMAGVKAIYSSGESQMSTIEFLGIYTDSPEQQIQGKMNVYPNPSKGSFTIELDGEYEVSILNSLGVTVYNKIIAQQGQIALKDLHPGMYIISAKSDKKAVYNRIIIQ